MEHRPVVTIILFAHAAYARFLPDSLKSILGQSYEKLEILVLSDGSHDVDAVVEQFGEDKRVSVCAQTRSYFLESANDLMTNSQGKYLGTWNCDDIYNRQHVELLVQALENDREAGGAFDNTEYFQDPIKENGEQKADLILSEDRAKILSRGRLTVQDVFDENIMIGPSSLITKTAFDRVGGYDAKIRLNCDLHWFYRLAAFYPVRFVNYLGVRKRVHPLNNTAVLSHHEFGARELEDIRDNYPEVYQRIGAETFNKKLGRKYFRQGLYYERQGDIATARQCYKRAMVLRKFSLRYHWEYCRSMLAASKN
jgi:glycosyltransferase involved in cell wall biosynthesis